MIKTIASYAVWCDSFAYEKLIRSAERLYDACLGGYVVVFYFISYKINK